MKQVTGYPPNFSLIREAFPRSINPGVIFSYGDTIYVPSGNKVPPDLIAHEEVHGKRQVNMGINEWWNSYIYNIKFRYHEELLAHRAEYKYFVDRGLNRAQRRSALVRIARRLSSALYGFTISFEQAKKDLQ